MCPANFAATNPEALRQALETQGESLTRGLANLLGDVQQGAHQPDRRSARSRSGATSRVTPGAVVFENELIQLIQYAPTTAEVRERPLVMVPPCINKYYILDLQPENSFVRYAVRAGAHGVHGLLAQRRAGAGHLTWDDYLEMGVLHGACAWRARSRGAEQVNALGFCVGGTLLGAALAVLAAQERRPRWRASRSSPPCSISPTPARSACSSTRRAWRRARRRSAAAASCPARELAFVFSSLRANDLVWPYVVNNYLLGGQPPAFDLLYWNADSTNLPGPMYCYYLRNTYLENKLRVPGALSSCGVPVDLGQVDLPVVHPSPRARTTSCRGAPPTAPLNLIGGEKTFVLGASGHIAGVVNPLSKNRRSYWTGRAISGRSGGMAFSATEHQGSWWRRWADWLAQHRGGTRKAPKNLGNAKVSGARAGARPLRQANRLH